MSTHPRRPSSFILAAAIIITLLVLLSPVLGQNCVESGRWCNDDKACCGGCCRNNQCIDMYESCLVYDDLCLETICPPGLVCYVYQPDCTGCSPIADCKIPSSEPRPP